MLACVGLFAGVADAAMVTSSAVHIVKINIEVGESDVNDARVYLTFSSPPVNTRCREGSSGSWLVGGNAASVERIRASALSAKLAGLPVVVAHSDAYTGTLSCSSSGTNGYPVVRGLVIP